MASNPIPNGYGQFTINWLLTGNARTLSCTIGYLNQGSIEAEIAAERMENAMQDGSLAFGDAGAMNAGYELSSIYALQMRGGILESHTRLIGIAGTVANPSPPVNTCIVIAKETARAGRQFRGRMEWPVGYIDEQFVNQNAEMDSTRQAFLQGHASDMLLGMVTRSIGPVILHDQPKDPLAPIPTPTPIIALNVRAQLGSARKRLKRFTG